MMGAQPITPRKALIAAHIAHMAKTSTMPPIELHSIAKNKPRKMKTTNGITAAIIDYVTYTGGYANRINVSGRVIKTKSVKTVSGGIIEGREVRIKSSTKRGTPDIDIVYNGIAIKVEVKNENTKDTISAVQSKEHAKLQAAGAIVFVADSFDSFYYWWHENIVKTKTA